MVNIESEFNNETNDFDLEAEKSKVIKGHNVKTKVPLSTLLTQIKNCKNLLNIAKELKNAL